MMTMTSSVAHDPITDWRRHSEFLQTLPLNRSAHRGCLGLGLSVDDSGADSWLRAGDRLFVPNAALSWYTAQDLWAPHWRPAREERRPVHLASVFKCVLPYGVPRIGEISARYDLVKGPGDGPEQIDPVTMPQAFRIFTAIELAMTSTAVSVCPSWTAYSDAFRSTMGVSGKAFLYGGGSRYKIEPPECWMPKPYLAFRPRKAARLSPAAERYPLPFRYAFFRDLDDGMPVRAPVAGVIAEVIVDDHYKKVPIKTIVIVDCEGTRRLVPVRRYGRITVVKGQRVQLGDVLGHDCPRLPREWDDWGMEYRWDWCVRCLSPEGADTAMEIWFDRQKLQIVPGMVHVRADLCITAARLSSPGELMWDIEPAMSYYDERADACIFPPLPLAHWTSFRFPINDCVELDTGVTRDRNWLQLERPAVRRQTLTV